MIYIFVSPLKLSEQCVAAYSKWKHENSIGDLCLELKISRTQFYNLLNGRATISPISKEAKILMEEFGLTEGELFVWPSEVAKLIKNGEEIIYL